MTRNTQELRLSRLLSRKSKRDFKRIGETTFMKKAKYTLVKWLITLALVLTASVTQDSFKLSAYAKTENGYTTSDNWITPGEIIDNYKEPDVAMYGAATDAVYDARKAGMVTSVKNQGNYATCWAFSLVSVMETNLIKNGLATPAIDLSENGVAYFFYNRQIDKLGYTAGDYNTVTGCSYLNAAGTLQGTCLELATGMGVLTEAQSPYLTEPSPDLCYAGDYVVKDVYMYNYNQTQLDASVAKIKQAITDHGSVACGIYYSPLYLNSKTGAYYFPKSAANHAVTVVGWDDNYSASNFVTNPGRNGAWIVKNSYGTSNGKSGYIYISYSDKSLAEFVSLEMTTRTAMYNNYYQHDGTGFCGKGYRSAEWYANVFKAKGAGEFNEELKAFGICVMETGLNYEVQVYTGLTSPSKPTSGTKAFATTVKGSFVDAGFHIVEFPEPVSLTAGENFAVLVKLTNSVGGLGTILVDTTYVQNPTSSSVSQGRVAYISSTGKNQTFIKVSGKWYDMATALKANARIKAYTNVTADKSNFHLSTNNLSVSKGAKSKISLLAAPYVHRKVTWKSKNTKIASVNTKGEVKGKKFGATVITGTFVAGAKKKTIKCKLTVGPAKIKGFKVAVSNKVKVSWKKCSTAAGYEVYYGYTPDGKFAKLATINKQSKTSCSKALPSGVYYIKMRPFRKSGKKKLYGSYTGIKEVIVP
jgi:C1A family cysteine protease